MERIQLDYYTDGTYGGFDRFAVWNRRLTYKTIADAKKDGKTYSGNGAIEIDTKTCFAGGLLPPADPDKTYKAEEIDARPARGSDAIDRGVVLPNFNDDYTGKAPDLGCFEYGRSLPHYGPR